MKTPSERTRFSITETAVRTSTRCLRPTGVWEAPSPAKILIRPPYRMSQTGRENLSCGVWLLEEYEVNPDLILESIVLPKDPPGETELHILGITLRL